MDFTHAQICFAFSSKLLGLKRHQFINANDFRDFYEVRTRLASDWKYYGLW